MKNLGKFWKKFRAGLFTNTQFLTGMTLSLLFTSGVVWAFTVASMTTFTSGTPISSAQVNDNFTYLKERLEVLSGDKFVVSTSTVQSFPTVACCGGNTLGQLDYDTVESDLSATGIGTDFTTNDFIIISEGNFYEVSVVGQVETGSVKTSGDLKIQKYTGGVGSPTYITALNIATPGGSFQGTRQTVWLKSGDKVEVVGEAGCCGAGDVDVQAGSKFTLKKL